MQNQARISYFYFLKIWLSLTNCPQYLHNVYEAHLWVVMPARHWFRGNAFTHLQFVATCFYQAPCAEAYVRLSVELLCLSVSCDW